MRKILKGETYEDYDYDELNTYAGIDTIVTLDLLKALSPRLTTKLDYRVAEGKEILKKKGIVPTVWSELINVKTLALEFTCDLKITGMYYDQVLSRQFHERMTKDMKDTQERINEAAGEEVPLSGAAFHAWLYRKRRYPSVIKTTTGEEATSGDALKALAKEVPEDKDLLLDIKRFIDVRAMFNNFIHGYIEKFVKYDSRIHCDYLLNGTSSHRISSKNPNMLNMPRGYYGYNLRDCYAATPGYSLLAFDFSSCEVKILAALSGDPNMIYACEQGYDFHSFSASMMMDITYEEFLERKHEKYYKDQRQFAKAVTFGILYGSSVGGIAMTLGITSVEAQRIIDSYFDKFPKVRDFINKCHQDAQLNLFVFSPFGQRKQEFGAHPAFKGSAVYNAALRNSQNVSIQGPASTFGLICFAMLNRDLKQRGIGRAVLTVYDSVEFEVKKGHEAEAIELAFYYLDDWPVENFEWLNFKVGSDGELGPTFGTLEEVHRGTTQDECNWIMRIQEDSIKPASCNTCGKKGDWAGYPYKIGETISRDCKCSDGDCGDSWSMDCFTE